jgi:hypothetical protein
MVMVDPETVAEIGDKGVFISAASACASEADEFKVPEYCAE